MPVTDAARLLAVVRASAASPDDVRAALTALLAVDPAIGVAAALDLLAGEPRVKPSRGLVIDPHDGARRRWGHRVAAATALLDSPEGARIAPEVRDELDADPDLAGDVALARAGEIGVRPPSTAPNR